MASEWYIYRKLKCNGQRVQTDATQDLSRFQTFVNGHLVYRGPVLWKALQAGYVSFNWEAEREEAQCP